MAEINETCAKWRASGEELDSYLTDGNWETFHTVRWMEENDIDRLTRDMIYRLSVSGTIELKREGMAQLYFYANDPGVAGASASIIGGADSPASILVESSSASVIGGADQPTSILVKQE